MLANAYYRASIYQKGSMVIEEMFEQIDHMEDGASKVAMSLDASNIKAMIVAKTGSVGDGIEILKEGLALAEENQLKSKMTQRYNNLGFLYRENGHWCKL